MRRACVLVALAALLGSACSSGNQAPSAAPVQRVVATTTPTTTTTPEPSPEPVASSQTPQPTRPPFAEPTPAPVLSLPGVDGAGLIELAPLGTFVVARPGAGLPRTDRSGDVTRVEIPVYDTPLGPPRTLLDVNVIDATSQPVNLTNWPNDQGALVLRVIAGGPDDDWLIVQAPSRPHDSYVWVRRDDFDFGSTKMRIEIDLAEGGGLTLLDGATELLQTEIVHGRESRPTPTHLTFIERGIRASSVSPAYGTAILSMASFSEVMGTFGGGVPSNFLHGTNQPFLIGQRVSSGSIRVPNAVLDQIIELVVPGTPVLMFNSQAAGEDRNAILERTLAPAATTDFAEGTSFLVRDGTERVTPQLWQRCSIPQSEQLLCRLELAADERGRYAFVTALPDAGEFNDEAQAKVIAVYDSPGGEPRMLVHQTPDRIAWRMPLRNPVFDQPLVLWPLEVTPDGEWIRVQAPIRPQRQSVWVRARDFEFGYTDYRIEIDIAGQGNMTMFDGDTELFSNLIVSGRQSRPTPLGATYIDWVIEGETLSPAYGSYVFSMPLFSDTISTFGGVLAKQSIHGTNQPEQMGQQVASGHIRLPNEVLTLMAEQPGGLVGARVVTVDSTGTDRAQAIAVEESRPWAPALTTDPGNHEIQLADPAF